MHNGLFRAHFGLPARIRYCAGGEKEVNLVNPVCGRALINLIRKVNLGELVGEGERRLNSARNQKYNDAFCLCTAN